MDRWQRGIAICSAALAVATAAVGCARHDERTAPWSQRCSDAGNDGVRLWRCQTPLERRTLVALTLLFTGPKKLRVLGRARDGAPDRVIDIKSRVRGSVMYGDVWVISSDNENGTFVTPIRVADGRTAYLTWKMLGEFDIYQGLTWKPPS